MLESVRQSELIQVRRELYANIDQLSNSMIGIEAIIPGGILCLWSACYHYRVSILEIFIGKMVLEGYNIRFYDIEMRMWCH